jgi:DNA mismatch endonuclease (patch repair protein)
MGQLATRTGRVMEPGFRQASWASSPARRRNMQANRSRDTKPELEVRRALHAMGLRYRVACRPLPDLRRTADIVFRPVRLAVFIDGCYWHGCPEHYRAPREHREYWSAKIGGNVARDLDTNDRLAAAGWTVFRFWEHDDLAGCALEVARLVRELRAG